MTEAALPTPDEIAPLARSGVERGLSVWFARFWSLFRVKRTYSIGVDYKAKADKTPIKLAAEVTYRKYFWDWAVGSSAVKGQGFGGATMLQGDPLAVAIVSAVKTQDNRFLKSELPRMEKVVSEHLADQLLWIHVDLLALHLYRYGVAATEEKKK